MYKIIDFIVVNLFRVGFEDMYSILKNILDLILILLPTIIAIITIYENDKRARKRDKESQRLQMLPVLRFERAEQYLINSEDVTHINIKCNSGTENTHLYLKITNIGKWHVGKILIYNEWNYEKLPGHTEINNTILQTEEFRIVDFEFENVGINHTDTCMVYVYYEDLLNHVYMQKLNLCVGFVKSKQENGKTVVRKDTGITTEGYGELKNGFPSF